MILRDSTLSKKIIKPTEAKDKRIEKTDNDGLTTISYEGVTPYQVRTKFGNRIIYVTTEENEGR